MSEKEEGTTRYIRERLLEAGSADELEEICQQLKADPDVNAGTVDAEKSRLKKKGSFRFAGETTKAIAKGRPHPIEELIEELSLPSIVDGTRHVFDSGVAYGMKSILIGVRVAQELSKMGIDQASPIIKMAQEMRQTEGQVARDTGMAMGETMANKMFELIDQRLPQKQDMEKKEDSMQGMLNRVMETLGTYLMGSITGGGIGPNPGLIDKRNQGGNG